MVLSRLGYGNATLARITSLQLRRLQSVMNAAARLVYSRSDRVTPLLRSVQAGGVGLPVFTWTCSGLFG